MEGDSYVFESSVQSNEEPVLFESKKYNFIVDNTSNQGQFTGGQIQFTLNTLNSQSQWVDLREAVIEFPIKITAQLTTALAGGNSTTTPSCGINAAILKAGFHQWINGAQLIVNGQTIQSLQQFENVAASFRILSKWSQDTLKKWGTTTAVALDDMTADSTAISTAGVDTVGLNNATAATVITSARGFDAVNNQAVLANRGIVARAKLCNTTATQLNVAGAIIGQGAFAQSGISNVAVAASNTANDYLYTQFIMATVRVRDLFDIDEFPLVKNITGFMYLSYNSFTVNLTSNTPSSGAATLASMSLVPQNGQTNPFLINTATNGVVFGTRDAQVTTASVIQFTGSVNGTATSALTQSGATSASAPIITQARLVAPFYVANPRVDAALTKHDHRFSTLEKIVNPIFVPASGSTNYTITVGVPNPRRLVLLPMWQSLGGASLAAPEYSPFDTCPGTSGPYAYLNQLQVYVANKPLFQYGINYDFEMWQSEISSNGLHGNVSDEQTSGLLTQQLWAENHRYYTIDLERRTDAEDGAAKSIQVSFTNTSTAYGLKVIAIVFYEKHWEIDTDICRLRSYA